MFEKSSIRYFELRRTVPVPEAYAVSLENRISENRMALEPKAGLFIVRLRGGGGGSRGDEEEGKKEEQNSEALRFST